MTGKLAISIIILGAILTVIYRALLIADVWPDVASKYGVGAMARHEQQQPAPSPPAAPPLATGSIEKKRTTRSEPKETTAIEDFLSLFGYKPPRR
jgi:hypothetical protein